MDNENPASPSIEYVGFWKRVGMHVVDALILAIPAVIIYRVSLNISLKIGAVYPFMIYWILLYTFYILMIVKFGGTPGKLINKTRIVNHDGKYLTIVKATIRYVIYILYSIVLTVILNEAIHAKISSHNITHYLNSSSGIFAGINHILGLLVWIDGLIIALHIRKRAFHDWLAGSYVVTLRTYQYLKENNLSLKELPSTNAPGSKKVSGKIIAWIFIIITSFFILVSAIHFLAAQTK